MIENELTNNEKRIILDKSTEAPNSGKYDNYYENSILYSYFEYKIQANKLSA